MPERKKVKEYRETLQQMAKSRKGNKKGKQGKELEGQAAKLGVELYGEERKGKPAVKLKGKPRR
jgi:hypothetical protein